MKLSAPIPRLKHKAKLLARETGIRLAAALDRIAVEEGFAAWSHLAARAAAASPAARLLGKLSPGDMVLVGARPGQGKTLLGLGLLAETMKRGGRGVFFTLEYTEAQVVERFRSSGIDKASFGPLFELDSSDGINADRIAATLGDAAAGTVAVIDYLQLLDQKREHPPLQAQMTALRALARAKELTLVFLSQIDRSYDPAGKSFPDLDDVRLPNPLDLGLFDKACFLQGDAMRIVETR